MNGRHVDVPRAAGWELCKSMMFKTREKRSSATGARFSRFILGKNPVVGLLDNVFKQPDEEEAEAGGLWAWLVFRSARSGTNREGGFTEAQLSQFVEEARDPSIHPSLHSHTHTHTRASTTTVLSRLFALSLICFISHRQRGRLKS